MDRLPGRGMVMLLLVLSAARWGTPAGSLPPREIAYRVSKGLVLIQTRNGRGEALTQASGFFIEPGVIVTNLHVFKRAAGGEIQMVGRMETFPIDRIVGFDITHDLCLFTVVGRPGAVPLALRALNDVAVGDEILAAGNPQGLEGTFSRGIVSALRREEDLIQIDAALSQGSSGGPVVDLNARVVGIACSSLAPGQNLNFAIPARFIAAVARRWKLEVAQAGALMLADREKDNLSGPVKTVQVLQTCTAFNKNGTSTRLPGVVTERKTYDARGRLMEVETFSCGPFSVGAPIRKVARTFDAAGFLMRTVTVEDGTAPVEKRWSEREALEERIRMTDMEAVRRDTRLGITLSYDPVGRPAKQAWDKGETVYTYAYDPAGNVVEMKIYERGRIFSTTRYDYEFDFEHNWIRRKPSHLLGALPDLGYVPDEVISREITYH